MKKTALVLALMATAGSSFAQLSNPSFEDWYTTNLGNTALTGWRHEVSNNSDNTSFHGTYREPNSQHGTYALKLSRWYSYTWDQVRQTAAITYRPQALTGSYTYTDANVSNDNGKDTALVHITLTRWNSATNQRDTIGLGSLELSEVSSFTQFVCPITYTSSLQPDSVTVLIKPTRTAGQCVGGGWCSFLTIDDLAFSSPTGLPDMQKASKLKLYPNPANSHINIEVPRDQSLQATIISVTDARGAIVLEKQVIYTEGKAPQISVQELPAGLYLVKATTSSSVSSAKLVVSE